MLALRMKTAANIEVARGGQEAIDHLVNDREGRPRLVLLDLKRPKVDGLEVLRRIREGERTCLTPVVILTSSNAPDNVAASYRLGATATASPSTSTSSPRRSVSSACTGSRSTSRRQMSATSNHGVPGSGLPAERSLRCRRPADGSGPRPRRCHAS